MNYSRYNEVEYVKYIYTNGSSLKSLRKDLRLLAIYMRSLLQYEDEEKKNELKKELYNWCYDKVQGFNKPLYFKVINSIVDDTYKQNLKLVEVKSININKYELDFIDAYEGANFEYEIKKLMFTFLVQSKLNKKVYLDKSGKESSGLFFEGDSTKYNRLKKMANLPQKIKINAELIHEMVLVKLVSSRTRGLIYLNFMEVLKEIATTGDNTVALTIENFEDIGWYYDYYCNKSKMAICGKDSKSENKGCGRPFRKVAVNEIYCKDCRGYQPIGTKTINCIDCGCEVELDAKNTKSKRCENCQKARTRKVKTEKQRKYRQNTP